MHDDVALISWMSTGTHWPGSQSALGHANPIQCTPGNEHAQSGHEEEQDARTSLRLWVPSDRLRNTAAGISACHAAAWCAAGNTS